MRYYLPMGAKASESGSVSSRHALAALVLLAFLSPGAWLLVRLPPPPVAQALHLLAAAAWISALLWGSGFLGKLPRGVSTAVLLVTGTAVASLATGSYPVQQLLYDLYAEMPLVLWLVYPVVFVIAARVIHGAGMQQALRAVLGAGLLLVGVMVLWRWQAGFVTTFGSPAFSVPALAPVPFIALGLGSLSPRHVWRYRAAAVFLAAGLLFSTAGLASIFALGVGTVLTLAFAPGLLGLSGERVAGVARVTGRVLLAGAVAATVLAQVPVLTSRVVDVGAAREAEQTIATRLHLWQSAQEMVVEKPLLGYGPAGYRFSAVEYYDSGVFPYIVALGSDPIAYSAPSPHSLLWEVLTRLGVVGLLAFLWLLGVWLRESRQAVLLESGDRDRLLRTSLAIAAGVYVSSLLVTPVHFASGFLGVVLAGFAIGPAERSVHARTERPARVQSAVLIACAVLVACYGGWRMVGLSTGTITGQEPLAVAGERLDAAARVTPGDPLNERRRLEVALWTASTPEELARARQRVDTAPGYVTGYLPNLVHLAHIGLTRGEQLEVTDYSWERGLLERARAGLPEIPSLAPEELHLALVEGDRGALPGLIERAEAYGTTYPMTEEYVRRAREMMGQ